MTTLDELAKLLAGATKGKWSVTDEHEILSVETRNDPIDGTTYEERTLIAQGECSQNWGYIEWFNLADAALIVAAVNALPGLLDRVERLEADIPLALECSWYHTKPEDLQPADVVCFGFTGTASDGDDGA